MSPIKALQVLEIEPPFTETQLKRCYREALLVWHPDRFTSNERLRSKAQEKTKDINEAYILLKEMCGNEASAFSSNTFTSVESSSESNDSPIQEDTKPSYNKTIDKSIFVTVILVVLFIVILDFKQRSLLITDDVSHIPLPNITGATNQTITQDTSSDPDARIVSNNEDRRTTLKSSTLLSQPQIIAKTESPITASQEPKSKSPSESNKSNSISLTPKLEPTPAIKDNAQSKQRESNQITDAQAKDIVAFFSIPINPNHFHDWTDTSGTTIKAQYRGHVDDDKVLLKTINNETPYTVSIQRLSEQSKKLCEELKQRSLSKGIAANQHLDTDKRPASGEVIVDRIRNDSYRGKLTVENGLTADAFIKILRDDRLILSFYVRGSQKSTIHNIPDGTYQIIYCTGFGWDRSKNDFSRDRKAKKHDSLFEYRTSVSNEYSVDKLIKNYKYTTWSITLHAVQHGNAETSEITEAEFDKYQ